MLEQGRGGGGGGGYQGRSPPPPPTQGACSSHAAGDQEQQGCLSDVGCRLAVSCIAVYNKLRRRPSRDTRRHGGVKMQCVPLQATARCASCTLPPVR